MRGPVMLHPLLVGYPLLRQASGRLFRTGIYLGYALLMSSFGAKIRNFVGWKINTNANTNTTDTYTGIPLGFSSDLKQF